MGIGTGDPSISVDSALPLSQVIHMTTLRITFVGLNLFVADAANDTLHVLMPDTTGRGGGPRANDPHHAALRYVDPATPSSVKTVKVNGATIGFPTTPEPLGPVFQKGIVNISEFFDPKRKVLPRFLARPLDNLLTSHFIIPGGHVNAVLPMGVHSVATLPHAPAPSLMVFAPKVVVTAQLPGTTIDLAAAVVDGQSASPLDTLHSQGGVIQFLVLHLEDDELAIPPNCPMVSPGARSDHFPCFYPLFGSNTGPDLYFDRTDPPDAPGCVIDIAEFVSNGKPFTHALHAHGEVAARLGFSGVTPYTCMGGGGEGGP